MTARGVLLAAERERASRGPPPTLYSRPAHHDWLTTSENKSPLTPARTILLQDLVIGALFHLQGCAFKPFSLDSGAELIYVLK